MRFDTYPPGTPNWIEVTAPDVAASTEFYGGLFGWTFESFDIGFAERYVLASKDGEVVAGIGGSRIGQRAEPAYWNVYFATDDLESAIKRVDAAGGRLLAGPYVVEDSCRVAVVTDALGAQFGLWQAMALPGARLCNEPNTFQWNELVADDVTIAEEFYREAFGLTLEDHPVGDDQRPYLGFTLDGHAVAGTTPPPVEGIPPFWNIYLNVTDAEATCARAVELGGSVLTPTFEVAGIGSVAGLLDPQGAMFFLLQAEPMELYDTMVSDTVASQQPVD